MTLRIAVSSRALFHMEDGDKVYREQGQAAFNAYMRDRCDRPLRKGVAFDLIRKLLALNTIIPVSKRVEVVLLSRNSADAGMRVMSSVQHYGLPIERAVFTGGSNRFRYVEAVDADLFLSTTPSDVVESIKNGIAAATMLPPHQVHEDEELTLAMNEQHSAEDSPGIFFAFDGDAVLFSAEADDCYRRNGFDAFVQHELSNAEIPLGEGPFKKFFVKLLALQSELPVENSPLRVALVTARGLQSHGRVIRTLRQWGIQLNEAVFCGGTAKGPILKALGADVFFDDTKSNIASALNHNIRAACHVPFGPGGLEAAETAFVSDAASAKPH